MKNYDGWCAKYYWNPGKPYIATWTFQLTRRELIRNLNEIGTNWWRRTRRNGQAKAVKVRLVEVN
jgi:hypothetical protein